MCLHEDDMMYDGKPPVGINPAGFLFVTGLLFAIGFLISYCIGV